VEGDGGLIDGVAVMVQAGVLPTSAITSGYGRPGHSLASDTDSDTRNLGT